jgi:hypothetical protein
MSARLHLKQAHLTTSLEDQIWNAVAENRFITTAESERAAQSFASLPKVLRTTHSVRALNLSMFSPTATNWTRNVDVRQLAEAIRVNSTLEDVSIGTIGIPGMAGDTEWAV